MVDRGKDRAGGIALHEGAGAVVDGLAGNGHVVSVHHAVQEAKTHPLRDQARLGGDHRVEESEVERVCQRKVGVVAADGIIGEGLDVRLVASGGIELERADTQVAGRDAGKDGAWQLRLAPDLFARCDYGQRPCGWHAHCSHEFRDHVFAQHRADGGLAVPATREWGAPRALQLDVEAIAVRGDDLAQEMRPTIAKLRREAAELVAGIGLGDGIGPGGKACAGKPAPRLILGQFEAERRRQRPVQDQKPGGRGRIGRNAEEGPRQVARPCVVEGNHSLAPFPRYGPMSGAGQVCARRRSRVCLSKSMTKGHPQSACTSVERRMVGAEGFELSTYGTQNRRATRLRYAPTGAPLPGADGKEKPLRRPIKSELGICLMTEVREAVGADSLPGPQRNCFSRRRARRRSRPGLPGGATGRRRQGRAWRRGRH